MSGTAAIISLVSARARRRRVPVSIAAKEVPLSCRCCSSVPARVVAVVGIEDMMEEKPGLLRCAWCGYQMNRDEAERGARERMEEPVNGTGTNGAGA